MDISFNTFSQELLTALVNFENEKSSPCKGLCLRRLEELRKLMDTSKFVDMDPTTRKYASNKIGKMMNSYESFYHESEGRPSGTYNPRTRCNKLHFQASYSPEEDGTEIQLRIGKFPGFNGAIVTIDGTEVEIIHDEDLYHKILDSETLSSDFKAIIRNYCPAEDLIQFLDDIAGHAIYNGSYVERNDIPEDGD